MGNTRSTYERSTYQEPSEYDDIWWTNGSKTSTQNKENSLECESHDANNLVLNKNTYAESNEWSTSFTSEEDRARKLEEFKIEFERKQRQRRRILTAKREEMENLRSEVAQLKKENEDLKNAKKRNNDVNIDDTTTNQLERLRKENELLKMQLSEVKEALQTKDELCDRNRELKAHIAEMQDVVQKLRGEVSKFEKQKQDYDAHVVALKDVIKVSKQLIMIRETQLNELKQKILEIEKSLADRETNVLSQDLRQEYERQLQSIKNLRTLYEERQRADKIEKARLTSVLESVKDELEHHKKLKAGHEERIEELEKETDERYYEIKNMESNLGLAKAECRQYQAELAVINQLFSQILISFNNNQEVDLDKLVKLLEENHDLLQNIIVNEDSNTISSALPKVLLDLVNRINDSQEQITSKEIDSNEPGNNNSSNKLETIAEESESQTSSVHQLNSPEEIVENLPKVWRVLIELLSHQCAPVNVITEETEGDGDPCYKLVETPKGPNLVLSVSQTFIRLKDLILEKKSLEKELNHLKHLNGHLETRLQDQGKRLEMVSSELSKTWLVVGKLQKQHQVLHTQEQILRYELAQKRKLLNNLKEELENSREKWLEAREKNFNTEKQWKQLRTEFASRKINKDYSNNSVESGYSDEREGITSSDDEPGYETDVSECNQKLSIADDVEPSDDNNEAEPSEFKDVVVGEEQNSNAEDVVEQIEDNALDCTKNLTSQNGLVSVPSTRSYDENLTHEAKEDPDANCDFEEKPEKTDLVQTQSTEKTDCEETSPLLESADSAYVENNLPTELQTHETACGAGPTACNNTKSEKPQRTLEEVLAARDERLRRMEGQCQQLVSQVTNTTQRSVTICNKLEDLHKVYGEPSTTQSQTESQSSTLDDVDNPSSNETSKNQE